MYQVNVADTEFRVVFNYFRPEQEDLENYPNNGVTRCFIKEEINPEHPVNESGENEWVNVSFGEAFCHRVDNFCKNVGRKIALSRALKMLGAFGPEERRVFWEGYFEKMGCVK